MDRAAVPLAGRRTASRAHRALLGLWLGLPWLLLARRSADPFVAHHGRQAALALFGFTLLCVAHVLLHAAAGGVLSLYGMVFEEGAPLPSWIPGALAVLLRVNGAAWALETMAFWGFALRFSRLARAGRWASYPFIPVAMFPPGGRGL